jgi:DNA (cytosine-5)-methyltransferase 1
MTHVSLFSGIGGLDLAAEWAGFDTVLQVECDPYCLRVLRKHWPRVRRVKDVRWIHDIRRKIGTRSVDVLSGGFPCQPWSVAGKRLGTADARYLWPRMRDVVECLRPRWVVAENVRGLLSWGGGLAFEAVCSDLEALGYEVLPLVYPIAGVGAPHLRYRVFIISYRQGEQVGIAGQSRIDGSMEYVPDSFGLDDDRSGHGASAVCGKLSETTEVPECPVIPNPSPMLRRSIERDEPHGDVSGDEVASYSHSSGRDGRTDYQVGGDVRGRDETTRCRPTGDPWESESGIRRVASGVAHRVDRLRCLGNSVSPAQAFPVFRAIAETMKKQSERCSGDMSKGGVNAVKAMDRQPNAGLACHQRMRREEVAASAPLGAGPHREHRAQL